MNSYLDIAKTVLSSERRPMSGRQILRRGYEEGIVPTSLYGKTQHKTLQVRLSEDILKKRENSAFFRTKPGYFFLRQYINDPSIPEEYRIPMTARRRTRDLALDPILFAPMKIVEEQFYSNNWVKPFVFHHSKIGYKDYKSLRSDELALWAVATVVRGHAILCYRAGRYRENRDAFALKRTIAFSSLVNQNDHTLFDTDGFGIEDTAVRAAVVDLDIPISYTSAQSESFVHEYDSVQLVRDVDSELSLISLVLIRCPDWFEPTARRLSLNQLHWHPYTVLPNNIDDFDPWSQALLGYLKAHAERIASWADAVPSASGSKLPTA